MAPVDGAGDAEEPIGGVEALAARYSATRSTQVKLAIVRQYAPWVQAVGRSVGRSPSERDDVIQITWETLLRALERYAPEKGRFHGYARACVRGAIKRYRRDHTWPVRPPRSLQERYLEVRAGYEELCHRLAREPAPEEIAGELALDVDVVRVALAAAREALPLRQTVEDPARSAPEPTVVDDQGVVDDGVELEALLSALPARARRIVRLRFWGGLSQKEIGALVGISQMQVSRVLRASLQRLREATSEQPGIGGMVVSSPAERS